MQRPPRSKDEPLFGTAQIRIALLQGTLLLLAVLALYAWALGVYTEAEARAGAFIALVLGNLSLALADSMASGGLLARHRRLFWSIAGVVILVLCLIFAVPGVAPAFYVTLPDADLFALSVAVPLLVGIVATLLRALRDRRVWWAVAR
jgi:Ca2+-transporting ATPase